MAFFSIWFGKVKVKKGWGEAAPVVEGRQSRSRSSLRSLSVAGSGRHRRRPWGRRRRRGGGVRRRSWASSPGFEPEGLRLVPGGGGGEGGDYHERDEAGGGGERDGGGGAGERDEAGHSGPG